MRFSTLLHTLLSFILAANVQGDDQIVTVESITCDSSCSGCATLNNYYFESDGARTDDFVILGVPSALVAEG